MKKIKVEKRVINIPRDKFNYIKEHCEKNSLDMVNWMIKNSLEKIIKELPDDFISSDEADEIKNKSNIDLPMGLPSDWMSLVVKKINNNIKTSAALEWNVSVWNGCVEIENIYGYYTEIKLDDDQINQVSESLSKKGYKLSINPESHIGACKYLITW